ncbi:MAG: ferric uptake regulator, Fur family [Dehalococcoidia bacterium]|nr:ferric uptake regulator, Fur family [Dehalococcoidia bacterium]
MAKQRAVMDALREAGYRLTPQRMMVLQAMGESQEHLTAEAIHQRAAQIYPYLDIATVYRILHLLKRLHLVTEIDLGGSSAQYEVAEPNRHHHMVCHRCGSTFDLGPSYLEELRTRLVKEFGFEPDLEHFAIGGLCAGCASEIRAT